jgi:hypothetical protein
VAVEAAGFAGNGTGDSAFADGGGASDGAGDAAGWLDCAITAGLEGAAGAGADGAVAWLSGGAPVQPDGPANCEFSRNAQ